jgi:hypothetical protein
MGQASVKPVFRRFAVPIHTGMGIWLEGKFV